MLDPDALKSWKKIPITVAGKYDRKMITQLFSENGDTL